ncbi:protein of unknown function [Acidithiobacillus ferrivorans]|uniref:Uncharacterized protein n=1 Tax=Acidithiobacillus ferrivorans TaxID=160808 RepID=A0ABY1MLE3_9PROT|nr:hypothetical protein [Acidithiobacillus ferrivorans]SMH64577.1 protein of unknown function [Acidithiobacillus ferrivorans]
MLRSPNGEPQSLVFAEAQIRDQFYLVGTSTITGSPLSITLFTVERGVRHIAELRDGTAQKINI